MLRGYACPYGFASRGRAANVTKFPTPKLQPVVRRRPRKPHERTW